ncbi:hypothetical protein CS062_12205, partial [Roseateles chitinivorans]
SASAVTVSAGTSGGMAGAFKDSGDERSTTRSTISAGSTTITSGDAASQAALEKLDRGATNDATAGKLAQGWDGQKLAQQVKVNAQIVAEFGAEASSRVAEYAKGKLIEAARLEAKADQAKGTPEGDAFAAEAAKLKEQWDVDGSLRIAAHAIVGGLTGNLQGALGAAAGTAAAPKIGDALIDAGLDPELTKNLVALASATVGAAAGGASGAAAAFNEAENNYRTMSPIRDVRNAVNKAAAQLYDKCGANCTAEDYRRMDYQLARIESSSTLLHIVANGGGLTEKQAVELAQTVGELLPVFGTAESVAQALTGKSILTGEETNQYLAAVGAVPVLGFLFKRMPKDIPGRIAYLMQDAKAYMGVDNAAMAAEKIAEAGKLAGVPVDAQAVAKRLGELSEAGDIKKINIVDPGARGDWGKAINGELQKDAAYVLTNGHSYVTDAAGRVKQVAGELSLEKMDRNLYAQLITGKAARPATRADI